VGTHYDNAVDMYQKGRSTPPRHKGASHGNAKVTDEIVRFIRSDKRTAAALSKELAISASQITRIRRGESWTHVE
jgi:hypothetical protein